MRVQSSEVYAAAGVTRWTLRRWFLLGAFGDLPWPSQKGHQHGQLGFDQRHMDRVRFVRACLKLRLSLAEIAELHPRAWADAGAVDHPAKWKVADVKAVIAVRRALDAGESLEELAQTRSK